MTLERILNDNPIENLPVEWQTQQRELRQFSSTKSLYTFQIQALESAIKTLWLYYGQNERKTGERLKQLYRNNWAYSENIEKFNRMVFWMATGSGKTLVIVKLIELLGNLINEGRIPRNDIMFLVYRDNLLRQFIRHVEEYNSSLPDLYINLIDLKDYERAKRENAIRFENAINVFYYRADLFFEKSTAKKINPETCDNLGKWYVLLDEAHKGDKNESKLQGIYNNFARDGFLFNFSATFTDDIDIHSCAYNFNLEKFIESGYGKKMYISEESIEGFREHNEFSGIEKQRVVLKTLILQTYIKKHLHEIRATNAEMYHKPLLLTIVNSVNAKTGTWTQRNIELQKPDLQLFFSELEKVARGDIAEFDNAKKSLVQELRNARYFFGSENIGIDSETLSAIRYDDVLKAVFNAEKSGKIEAVKVPGKDREIMFTMLTSNRPFALIRIGDTRKWINGILQGYEINEKFESESFFDTINEPESSINILMGSRTFYEGWDSNRPNIILFINIGMGKDSKKFVLQSVGRGVRIEPVQHKRRRIQNLINSGEVNEALYRSVKNLSPPLESLFVFGTNAENLRNVIESLRSESSGSPLVANELNDLFRLNLLAQEKNILIPRYRVANELADESTSAEQSTFPISEIDLQEVKKLWNALSDRIIIVKYGISGELLYTARAKIAKMKPYGEIRTIHNPNLLIKRLLAYFSMHEQTLDTFTPYRPRKRHYPLQKNTVQGK